MRKIMANFIKTEETENQLLALKSKHNILTQQVRSTERHINAIKEELKLLEVFIEDYDGFGLLWIENNEQ